MTMTHLERAKKDIEKLEKLLATFRDEGLAEEYPTVYTWAENYYKDAVHFLKKGDYFSAFGCANYAYGILDSILINEARKKECGCYE